MVFVATVREVHPHHVQARLAQLVDGLDRVGLGADGADDGSPAQVALRLVGCVELGEPFDLAAELEVVERSRHCEGLPVCGGVPDCVVSGRGSHEAPDPEKMRGGCEDLKPEIVASAISDSGGGGACRKEG